MIMKAETENIPNFVEVRVKLSGSNNFARAGSGKAAKTASSTNCGAVAAEAAAAKYFGRIGPAFEIHMRLTQSGSCSSNPPRPEIYEARIIRRFQR
jgi:hypothetical protein